MPADPVLEDLDARLRASRAQLRELATMGAVIASIQEIDTVLTVVLDMALRLVDGEVGLIMLERGGDLKAEVTWGISGELAQSIVVQDGLSLPEHVYRKAEAVIVNGLDFVGAGGVHVNSAVCLPLRTSQACLGSLLLVNKYSGGHFEPEDREILEMLVNFATVAIDNSRLVQHKLERQKQEQELLIARQVQTTILPQNIQPMTGVNIGAAYHPMGEVGGDFYDLIPLGPGRLMAVLGDVSSHGVPAALVMSATAGIIKAVLASRPDIEVDALAGHVNDLLVDGIIKDKDMFVTLFLARLDLPAGQLACCNAGHLPGLFLDAQSGTIESISQGGLFLGQFPGAAFSMTTRGLRPGDRLFLFTDGLSEAANKSGELFGLSRTREAFVNGISLVPSEFCRNIKQIVNAYSGAGQGGNQDDFTVLLIEVAK